MHDVAAWVQELNDLRAELVGQFGDGLAVAGSLARLARLSLAMVASDPATAPDQPAPDVSPRTAEVFNLVLGLHARTGLVPTVQEMCRASRINAPAGIEYQLRAMEAAGLISRPPKPPGRHTRRPTRAITFLRTAPLPVTA